MKINSFVHIIFLTLVHGVWCNSKTTLYNSSDFVIELDVNNFNREVYGRNRGCFVEFYYHWCSHCQQYAPVYKETAEYFKYSNIVMAAVSCTTEINGPLCRNFGIQKVPQVKYFHENYIEHERNFKSVSLGPAPNVRENIKNFIGILLSEQRENRAKMIPRLEQYENANFRKLIRSQGTTILILDPTYDRINLPAVHAILSLHGVPNLHIKYATKMNNILLTKLNIHSPSIVAINQGKYEILPMKSVDPIETIKKYYMNERGVNISQYLRTSVKTERESGEERDGLASLRKIANSIGDAVFQMDLESALRLSLLEIARSEVIAGEKLAALRNYFEVLKNHFPTSRQGRAFLNKLFQLARRKNYVNGKDIESLAKNAKLWSTKRGWLGCAGSKPNFRGYPCGMWKMFHYLTVNAADNPKKVLAAMHGYIKHFFGCSKCSNHFQDMAARRKIWMVSRYHDAVLWLWRAHNEVNNRLAGDATEDPKFPKIQFPSEENCPRCRSSDGSWNDLHVLTYVINMYKRGNIKHLGAI